MISKRGRSGDRCREGRSCEEREKTAIYSQGEKPQKPTLLTLIWKSCPPELWENKLQLFKPLRLWRFVMAAPANSPTTHSFMSTLPMTFLHQSLFFPFTAETSYLVLPAPVSHASNQTSHSLIFPKEHRNLGTHLVGQMPSKDLLQNEDQLLSPTANEGPYWPFQLYLAPIWTNLPPTNYRAWFSFWIPFLSTKTLLQASTKISSLRWLHSSSQNWLPLMCLQFELLYSYCLKWRNIQGAKSKGLIVLRWKGKKNKNKCCFVIGGKIKS